MGAALLGVAALAGARSAVADEPKPVEVVVKPEGRPWSIGSHGGSECNGGCTLHLLPDHYRVTMGDAAEEVWIRGPTQIRYHPSVPVLRYSGGGLALGGLAVGGVMTYLAVKLCVDSTTSPDGTVMSTSNPCKPPTISRTAQYALIGVGTGAFAAAVVGAILFFVGGESINVVEQDVPDPPRRRSFDLVFNADSKGGSLGVSWRF